jgi:hypothetical protein
MGALNFGGDGNRPPAWMRGLGIVGGVIGGATRQAPRRIALVRGFAYGAGHSKIGGLLRDASMAMNFAGTYLRRAVTVVLAALLLGCGTQPITRVEPDFRGISAPDRGFAKLYLLRPAFSELSHADTPIFQVDGSVTVKLSFGSYAELQLPPGKHSLSVRPGPRDSDIWNGDFEFTVGSDAKYFLGVWNDVKHVTPPRVPGLVPFLIVKSLTSDSNAALRIELVSEEDALPVLKESRYAEISARAPAH